VSRARLALLLVVIATACKRESDRMPCGSNGCDPRESYCEIYLSDVADPPTDYRCRPLPERCKPRPGYTPSCECFPSDTPCLSFCGPLAAGTLSGFHLTCQGVKRP
jgi:hypothetical protein